MDETHIGLGGAQLELDQTDLGPLHPDRAAGALEHRLGENQAVDELAVLEGSSDLLDYPDVLQVHVICGLEVDGLGNRVDGHGSQ